MSAPYWDDSPAGSITAVVGNQSQQVTWPDLGGPGSSGPDYVQNPWDTCTLGAVKIPGLVQVLCTSKQRRLQNKKQNGSDGATPTFRGLDPAKVTIHITIWTPNHISLMNSIMPIIFPNPNKDINKLSALDISHPVTDQRGVKAIIVEDIDGPSDGHIRGSKQYSLKCYEYLPNKPKPAVKTPTGAVAVVPNLSNAGPSKNNPPKPSSTDFGPLQSIQPQQGRT